MRAKKALFLLPTLTAPSGAAKGHSVWGGGAGAAGQGATVRKAPWRRGPWRLGLTRNNGGKRQKQKGAGAGGELPRCWSS